MRQHTSCAADSFANVQNATSDGYISSYGFYHRQHHHPTTCRYMLQVQLRGSQLLVHRLQLQLYCSVWTYRSSCITASKTTAPAALQLPGALLPAVPPQCEWGGEQAAPPTPTIPAPAPWPHCARTAPPGDDTCSGLPAGAAAARPAPRTHLFRTYSQIS